MSRMSKLTIPQACITLQTLLKNSHTVFVPFLGAFECILTVCERYFAKEKRLAI